MSNNGFRGFEEHHLGAYKTRSYEDRGFYGELSTKSGLLFSVALVADGVGGGSLGQRAAELTVEVIKKSIQASNRPDAEIPQILGEAIGTANKAVFEEARGEKNKTGMSATVSIALVYKRKLYVANVGDSRVYLVRDGEAKQITVDHTFAEEKIRSGQLPPDKAYAHPKAEYITRSVGFEPKVRVDLGLYLKSDESGQAAYANQGLALGVDDVVLVCSDGLIKERREDKNQHYVESSELVSTIKQFHADVAAKVLVDLAVGRNVDDNVTVVVVEDVKRRVRNFQKRNQYILAGVLGVILLFVGGMFLQARNNLSSLESENVQLTASSEAQTQIALSFTPEPTATPRPTVVL